MSAPVEPAAKISSRWLRPFARVTSGGTFLAEIDGLRAVAIGLVLLFHLAADLGVKSNGWLIPPSGTVATPIRLAFRGVELFFVISGFVLSLPFAAHHLLGKPAVPLRRYFLRRLTRIEPPYVIAMVLVVLGMIFLRGESFRVLGPHLAAGLVYQHWLIYGTDNPINGIAWSLEIEVQFYLLVPWLTQVFRIRSKLVRRTVLLVAMLVAATSVSLLLHPETRAWLSILRVLQFFLAGLLLADVYLLDWSKEPSHRLRWDLLALLLIAGLVALFRYTGSPTTEHGEPLLSLLAFTAVAPLFFAAAFRGVWLNRILTNPWLTAFGGMCYSIYLIHNQVLGEILSRTDGWRPTGRWGIDLLLQGLIAFPLMMIPIAIFFLAVEKPCMSSDWPRRLRVALGGKKGEDVLTFVEAALG